MAGNGSRAGSGRSTGGGANAASPERVAMSNRFKRAVANQKLAYANEADGPNSKMSRKASTARRAQQIYLGKVDPTVRTRARLTPTRDAEALRRRMKKIKNNNP